MAPIRKRSDGDSCAGRSPDATESLFVPASAAREVPLAATTMLMTMMASGALARERRCIRGPPSPPEMHLAREDSRAKPLYPPSARYWLQSLLWCKSFATSAVHLV